MSLFYTSYQYTFTVAKPKSLCCQIHSLCNVLDDCDDWGVYCMIVKSYTMLEGGQSNVFNCINQSKMNEYSLSFRTGGGCNKKKPT